MYSQSYAENKMPSMTPPLYRAIQGGLFVFLPLILTVTAAQVLCGAFF
jgi:hypothetical protein